MVAHEIAFVFGFFITSGVSKKVEKASKVAGCEGLALWKQSISNHLYWAAASTPADSGALIVAKWESLLHHMTDRHKDLPNPLYPACQHGDLDAENREKAWLEPCKYTVVKMIHCGINFELCCDIHVRSLFFNKLHMYTFIKKTGNI